MAVYPLQELRNLITDRVKDNHTRAIDGEELQEFLQDIIDSLEAHTDDSMESPAVNYYVNQILFDITTGALTLIRAGGIDPANISVDLDGRYRQLTDGDYRADVVTVEAGEQTVTFALPWPEGTDLADIAMPTLLQGKTAGGFYSDCEPYDLTLTTFKVNFDEAVTFQYHIPIKR
jgi:hypothetical protein